MKKTASVLGLVAAALLAGVGCSASADDGTGADDSVTGAATPAQNSLVFEQVNNVAMQAPIGALANLAAAKEDTPFCKAFVAGARHAQAPAAPPAKP